jgi:hypothetical protein
VNRLIEPSIEPEAGSYVGDIEVVLDCPGAPENTVVYYATANTKTPVAHGANPTVKCGEAITLVAPGEYTVRAFTKAPQMAMSPMLQAAFTLQRPKYDTKELDLALNAFRVRPMVDVTPVVLPTSRHSGSGSGSTEQCDAAVNVGHLATLSNVIGHFDIALPMHGCAAPFAELEKVTGVGNSYKAARNPFLGDDAARSDDSELSPKMQLAKRNRERYRAILPPNGVSAQQWLKWLVEYEDQDQGCVVAAAAGYFNMSTFACSGNLVAGGRLIQTSSRKNVNFGVRGNELVVGYVPKEEILNEFRPFDFLVAGSGWLVRNGETYVSESFSSDDEDVSYQPANFRSARIPRTAIGYNKRGELQVLQMSGEGSHSPQPDTGSDNTYVPGLTIDEFAHALVSLGFEQAINLVGGEMANMAVNHTIVSIPSSACPASASGSNEYVLCYRRVLPFFSCL